MYFYASRIRQDNKWEEVVQPADQRSDRMVNELEEYTKWTFSGYQFKEKKEVDPNKFYVSVWFEISVNGSTDDGTDQATVEMLDGKWVITEVPI